MKKILLLVFSQALFAEDVVLITADRIKTDLSKSANSIELIEEETIVSSNAQNLPELLQSKSDLQAANGSIFLRGTDSAHSLIVLDGVVLNDPTNPNRSFDISKLSLNNIQKIEILKGAQGMLYGANAVGGVIVLTSKTKSTSAFSGSSLASYGTYQTYHVGLDTHQRFGLHKVSFGAEHFNTRGFSAANEKRNTNAEADSEKRSAFNLHSISDFSAHSSLELSGRFIHSQADLDNCGGASCDDANNTLASEELLTRIKYSKIWNSELFETHFFYNRGHYFHHNKSASYHSINKGEINTFGINQTNYLSESFTQNINLDYAKESNHLKQYNENSSVFLYHKYDEGNYLYNFGLRLDHNKIFKDHLTYKLAVADRLNDEHLLRLSYSTGFQAPGLFQFLDPTYGNLNLKPEKSYSLEVGHEWNKKLNQLHTTFFMTTIYDRFLYVESLKKTINSGKTYVTGIEESFRTSLSNTSVTWLSKWQTRRPHLLIKNSFFYQDISFDCEYVGKRPDIDKNGATVLAPSYFLAHLNYSYKILFIKIKNLLNTEYEEAYGYGTGGRIITVGVKKSF